MKIISTVENFIFSHKTLTTFLLITTCICLYYLREQFQNFFNIHFVQNVDSGAIGCAQPTGFQFVPGGALEEDETVMWMVSSARYLKQL